MQIFRHNIKFTVFIDKCFDVLNVHASVSVCGNFAPCRIVLSKLFSVDL